MLFQVHFMFVKCQSKNTLPEAHACRMFLLNETTLLPSQLTKTRIIIVSYRNICKILHLMNPENFNRSLLRDLSINCSCWNNTRKLNTEICNLIWNRKKTEFIQMWHTNWDRYTLLAIRPSTTREFEWKKLWGKTIYSAKVNNRTELISFYPFSTISVMEFVPLNETQYSEKAAQKI